MKKIIIPIMALIIISSAIAIFGGESATIYEEDCIIAYVNITGNQTIESGEFILSDNCIFNEEWIYNCTCEEPIVLTTKVNTVNTYFVSTDIWKEKKEPEEKQSDNGKVFKEITVEKPEKKDECKSDSDCLENEVCVDICCNKKSGLMEKKCVPVEIKEDKIIDEEEEEEEEEAEPFVLKGYGWLWVTLLVIVAVIAIGYYIFKKK